jgi:hypothetical protein
MEGPITIVYGSSESVKKLCKCWTLEESELMQLDKVLHEWFTVMHSAGKPMTGPIIIKKLSLFVIQGK